MKVVICNDGTSPWSITVVVCHVGTLQMVLILCIIIFMNFLHNIVFICLYKVCVYVAATIVQLCSHCVQMNNKGILLLLPWYFTAMVLHLCSTSLHGVLSSPDPPITSPSTIALFPITLLY